MVDSSSVSEDEAAKMLYATKLRMMQTWARIKMNVLAKDDFLHKDVYLAIELGIVRRRPKESDYAYFKRVVDSTASTLPREKRKEFAGKLVDSFEHHVGKELQAAQESKYAFELPSEDSVSTISTPSKHSLSSTSSLQNPNGFESIDLSLSPIPVSSETMSPVQAASESMSSVQMSTDSSMSSSVSSQDDATIWSKASALCFKHGNFVGMYRIKCVRDLPSQGTGSGQRRRQEKELNAIMNSDDTDENKIKRLIAAATFKKTSKTLKNIEKNTEEQVMNSYGPAFRNRLMTQLDPQNKHEYVDPEQDSSFLKDSSSSVDKTELSPSKDYRFNSNDSSSISYENSSDMSIMDNVVNTYDNDYVERADRWVVKRYKNLKEGNDYINTYMQFGRAKNAAQEERHLISSYLMWLAFPNITSDDTRDLGEVRRKIKAYMDEKKESMGFTDEVITGFINSIMVAEQSSQLDSVNMMKIRFILDMQGEADNIRQGLQPAVQKASEDPLIQHHFNKNKNAYNAIVKALHAPPPALPSIPEESKAQSEDNVDVWTVDDAKRATRAFEWAKRVSDEYMKEKVAAAQDKLMEAGADMVQAMEGFLPHFTLEEGKVYYSMDEVTEFNIDREERVRYYVGAFQQVYEELLELKQDADYAPLIDKATLKWGALEVEKSQAFLHGDSGVYDRNNMEIERIYEDESSGPDYYPPPPPSADNSSYDSDEKNQSSGSIEDRKRKNFLMSVKQRNEEFDQLMRVVLLDREILQNHPSKFSYDQYAESIKELLAYEREKWGTTSVEQRREFANISFTIQEEIRKLDQYGPTFQEPEKWKDFMQRKTLKFREELPHLHFNQLSTTSLSEKAGLGFGEGAGAAEIPPPPANDASGAGVEESKEEFGQSESKVSEENNTSDNLSSVALPPRDASASEEKPENNSFDKKFQDFINRSRASRGSPPPFPKETQDLLDKSANLRRQGAERRERQQKRLDETLLEVDRDRLSSESMISSDSSSAMHLSQLSSVGNGSFVDGGDALNEPYNPPANAGSDTNSFLLNNSADSSVSWASSGSIDVNLSDLASSSNDSANVSLNSIDGASDWGSSVDSSVRFGSYPGGSYGASYGNSSWARFRQGGAWSDSTVPPIQHAGDLSDDPAFDPQSQYPNTSLPISEDEQAQLGKTEHGFLPTLPPNHALRQKQRGQWGLGRNNNHFSAREPYSNLHPNAPDRYSRVFQNNPENNQLMNMDPPEARPPVGVAAGGVQNNTGVQSSFFFQVEGKNYWIPIHSQAAFNFFTHQDYAELTKHIGSDGKLIGGSGDSSSLLASNTNLHQKLSEALRLRPTLAFTSGEGVLAEHLELQQFLVCMSRYQSKTNGTYNTDTTENVLGGGLRDRISEVVYQMTGTKPPDPMMGARAARDVLLGGDSKKRTLEFNPEVEAQTSNVHMLPSGATFINFGNDSYVNKRTRR